MSIRQIHKTALEHFFKEEEVSAILDIFAHTVKDAERYEVMRARYVAEHPRMTNDAYDAIADGLLDAAARS